MINAGYDQDRLKIHENFDTNATGDCLELRRHRARMQQLGEGVDVDRCPGDNECAQNIPKQGDNGFVDVNGKSMSQDALV